MKSEPEITVVVPLYNEELNLLAFFAELDGVMKARKEPFEIIFVNDGSTDNSEKILLDIAKGNSHVKVISLRENLGKARALEHGFNLVNGSKVIIIDCDLQYDPKDIQTLVSKMNEGYDVVSGKRVSRADTKDVVLTSIFFRWVVKRLSGLQFVDYFSGLKCFRTSVILQLDLKGDLNRIFSVYAYRVGFKVCEVPVTHRLRAAGKSRYNFLSRLKLAANDLIVLFYSITIGKENLYKFGLLGLLILSLGLLMLMAFLCVPSYLTTDEYFKNLVNRTGLFLVFIGAQLRIFEVVGKEFIGRLYREGDAWKSNIKSIYNSDPPP